MVPGWRKNESLSSQPSKLFHCNFLLSFFVCRVKNTWERILVMGKTAHNAISTQILCKPLTWTSSSHNCLGLKKSHNSHMIDDHFFDCYKVGEWMLHPCLLRVSPIDINRGTAFPWRKASCINMHRI